MKILHLTLFVLICVVFRANGQQDSIVPFEQAYKRVYQITKLTDQKPQMDGRLDDEVWQQQGEWSDRFVQIIP